MGKQALFGSDHVKVIGQLTGSDCVFVTFNEMGHLADGDRFWGDDFFHRLGMSAIGVVTPRPNWYPAKDMVGAVAAIRPFLEGKRVVTYGHSQGGYGALKYSRALDARAVLAFSPQSSINPLDVGTFDTRYSGYFNTKLNNGLVVREHEVSPNAYIMFDPLEVADRCHASALSFSGSTQIPIPFSGHESIKVPVEGGASAALMSLVLDSQSIDVPSQMRALMRQSRPLSKTYSKHKFWRLAHRSDLGFVKRMVQCWPEPPLYVRLVLAMAHRDFASASALMKECTDAYLVELGLFKILECCRKFQFVEGEIRSVLTLATWFPDDPMLRLQAVFTFERLGLRREAAGELRQIIKECLITEEVLPHIRFYANRVSKPGSALRRSVAVQRTNHVPVS